MKLLRITRDEAIQMLRDDIEVDHLSDPADDLSANQRQASKEMRKADRTTAYKFTKRERAPDDEKRFLIQSIKVNLPESVESVEVSNIERQIDFKMSGRHYRIILSAPRT